MARKVQIMFILLLLVFVSCKKSEDRSCWKGHGDETFLEIPITDSVLTWQMKKGIKYRIFQDSSRKIVVRGGENMIKHISVTHVGTEVTVENKNRCNFLRDSDRKVEVEVHYPYYGKFYFEPTDSVIFEDTIQADTLKIQLAFGGGSARLNVNTKWLSAVVSRGTGDILVGGYSERAEVKIQDKGFADATKLSTLHLFAFSNSRANLRVNIQGTNATIRIDGPGDIYGTGTPINLIEEINGGGEFLRY